ncbi:MAG: HAD family hydrolase [Desulfobacterales bacterium]|jgi:FMN phosphatase YigB (HAD superfamily)
MLIFDFDGVLINSLAEVTITVYHTTTGKRVTALADLPPALVKLFQRNRFHVQSIGDAILLMKWCLIHYQNRPETILNPQEYQAIISGAADPATVRTRRIYETRMNFAASDPHQWLALHQPYQPLWAELLQRKKYEFLILTNKNREATLRLCRHFGLNIDAGSVYSGDQGASKVENMGQIQKRFGCPSFEFIDDSIKNLVELDRCFNKDHKILALLFASWGYIGPHDEKLAQSKGYPVLKQEDLIAHLDRNRLPAENF